MIYNVNSHYLSQTIETQTNKLDNEIKKYILEVIEINNTDIKLNGY